MIMLIQKDIDGGLNNMVLNLKGIVAKINAGIKAIKQNHWDSHEQLNPNPPERIPKTIRIIDKITFDKVGLINSFEPHKKN